MSSILASLFASTSCGILLDSSFGVGYVPNLNVTGFFSANCQGFFALVVFTFALLRFENIRFCVSVGLYYWLLVSICCWFRRVGDFESKGRLKGLAWSLTPVIFDLLIFTLVFVFVLLNLNLKF